MDWIKKQCLQAESKDFIEFERLAIVIFNYKLVSNIEKLILFQLERLIESSNVNIWD